MQYSNVLRDPMARWMMDDDDDDVHAPLPPLALWEEPAGGARGRPA
jgi:hypothetical protein